VNSVLDPLLLVLLGFLLGVLGPVITDYLRTQRRTTELMKTIQRELIEIQYIMAILAFLMYHKVGEMPEFMNWLWRIIEPYRGPEFDASFIEGLAGLRAAPEETRRDLMRLSSAGADKGKTLKEETIPLLDAHVADLWTFPIRFQVAAINVKRHLNIYNQHVRYMQTLFDKTFSADEENGKILRSNLESGYRQLAQIARRVADAAGAMSTIN
jgi:hypothetical protein